MSISVLSVGYPFAPVSTDTPGGAEQVLSRLDHALHSRGHRSCVVAQEGSCVKGELISIPRVHGNIDRPAREFVYAACRAAIADALRERPIDLIHMHGVDFYEYLPSGSPPILATLHLPLSWYPPEQLINSPANVVLQCVSNSQRRLGPAGCAEFPVIENGVPSPSREFSKRDFVLCLGRICPEKGVHLAIDAARIAGAPLLIAGDVFPYEEHQRYFRQQVAPRISPQVRFLGPVSGSRKARLLGSARCVLIPSLAPETSSLVAMEALAAGTPVIAFRSGALSDIIEHGRTGFLVNDAAEMAEAIQCAEGISLALCRHVARLRFSAEVMIDRYFETYYRLSRASLLGASR